MKFKCVLVSGVVFVAALTIGVTPAVAQDIQERVIRLGDLNFSWKPYLHRGTEIR